MDSDANVTVVPKKGGIDPLNFVLDRLKSFGALVTAIVGLASTLFACSADNIKRNDAFVADVAGTEKQWQSLYDQYFAALAAKDDDAGLREKRLLSICQFSNRNIPDFKEHRLGYFWLFDGEARQKEAHDQLDKLKTGLRTALATDGIGTPKSAECVKSQKREQEEDGRNVRERLAQPVAQGVAESVSKSVQRDTANRVDKSKAIITASARTATTPILTTLTLAAGDPKGYDIDIFWCVGPDDAAKRAQAARVANSLSKTATDRASIGNLFRVGRVRLRPLSVEKQISGSYPSSGFEVRADSYERDVSRALVGFLNGQTGLGPFIGFESSLDTKYYLSIFVCS